MANSGIPLADNDCTFRGHRTSTGFQFETEFSDCSFPFHRPLSKWTIEIARKEIRVIEKDSNKVIRLARR